jgi:UDP-N-acetylmuramate--alanine ligase
LALPAVECVHFIGIGGYGMSALAQVLLQMGYRVTGSDIKDSSITRRLTVQGARINLEHHRDNVDSCGLVVYSTAVPDDNPELLEARKRGIPVWHRSELLANLLNERYGIAVAGTHGKTTTSTMIALLLEQGGLDPTAVIGGMVSSFNGNARLGRSRYLVAEACESDNSFLRYYPQIAIVTNMEPDHLEHYQGDFNRLREAYALFLDHLHPDGCAVLCTDDPNLRELAPRLDRKVVTYGLEGETAGGADYTGCEITLNGGGATFTLYNHLKPITGPITLQVPGRHNVSNAVGALAVAAQLGLDPEQCAAALKDFRGAGRRFEIVGEAGGVTVVDDYAHHPTEVRVTLEAARAAGRRICCIFQPHRYTRTAYFFDDFSHAFDGADMVLMHRIYSAGEDPIEGVTAKSLTERIVQVTGVPAYASDSMNVLADLALDFARPGDMILVMGAGDISCIAHSILQRLKRSQ